MSLESATGQVRETSMRRATTLAAVGAAAWCASGVDFVLLPTAPARSTNRLDGPAGIEAKCSSTSCHQARPRVGAAVLASFMAALAFRGSARSVNVARHGLQDRVKKDFSTKSAMIKKLGKLVLQREFDMRTQIMEDPKLALRSKMSQEELLADFERAVEYIKTNIGLNQLESEITVSKIATGLYMQYLGRPNFPSNAEMDIVLEWLLSNLAVKREDGSLGKCVANYPFVLSRTIEELNESKRFCPEDINYNVAVAEDPALIDKTYNCDGICANQCVACWYNG